MGMATGLFMTASNNRKLRLMMEDTKTGFVLYTGFPKIDFVSRSTCLKPTGGACSLSNKTIRNKSVIVERLQSSVNNINSANKILKSRPAKPKLGVNMRIFTGANGVPLSINASREFFKKVEKFLPYFTDNEFDQVDEILDAIEKRTTQNNKNAVLRDLRALRGNIRYARSNPYEQSRKRTLNAGTTPNRPSVNAPRLTPTPSAPRASSMGAAQMNVNNPTKRINNLNAYLNNLQRNLGSRGNLNKSIYLSNLKKTNTNGMLANIKARAKANADRILGKRRRIGSK
jgi:hypothetical protein